MSDTAGRHEADRDHLSPGPRPPVTAMLVGRLLLGMVVILGTAVLVGVGLTHVGTTGSWLAGDLRVERWFAAHRTATFGSLTRAGSGVANTESAVAVAVLAFFALRVWLRRWYESVVLVVVLGGELAMFLATAAIVHRPRPPVPRLDAAPPTSSFPSGHTAASVALFGFLAVVVWRYTSNRTLAGVLVAVLVFVPFVVAGSRMYRGMHYPTDVLAGAAVGGSWLVYVLWVLLPRPRPDRSPASPDAVAQSSSVGVVEDAVERAGPRA